MRSPPLLQPYLNVGVDYLGHRPDHNAIEIQTGLPGEADEPGHVHVDSQTHDNAHMFHIELEEFSPVPLV